MSCKDVALADMHYEAAFRHIVAGRAFGVSNKINNSWFYVCNLFIVGLQICILYEVNIPDIPSLRQVLQPDIALSLDQPGL